MKLRLSILLAGAGLLAAGCDSISDRFDLTAPPRTQVFAADPRSTYAAAKAALKDMDFRFVRGGPAEGELEAISAIVPGELSDSVRQVTLKAEFHPISTGGTEVDVWMKDIVQENADSRTSPATEAPLRNTPLYEVFFRDIQQGLPAAAPKS